MPRRPEGLTDEEWADWLDCQADHDDLGRQAAAREADIENGLEPRDFDY